MRLAMLGAALALAGCAKPPVPGPAVEPAVVLAPELAPAAVAVGEPEVAPMPRAIPDNPRWRARQESFRNDREPVLRGLARREIKAGDPVEPLIKRHPKYQVIHAGEFVILLLEHGYGGTSLVAKGGKLVRAETGSCIYQDVFFNTMTGEEEAAYWTAYDAALREELARRVRAASGPAPKLPEADKRDR